MSNKEGHHVYHPGESSYTRITTLSVPREIKSILMQKYLHPKNYNCEDTNVDILFTPVKMKISRNQKEDVQ